MLAYAFNLEDYGQYTQCEVESFNDARELLSALLIKGVSLQIKRGLVWSYQERRASLRCLRGKVEIAATIKQHMHLRTELVCSFDEFTPNNYLNQVLKTTLERLLKQPKPYFKAELKQVLLHFHGIHTLDPATIDWDICFNRQNQNYQVLFSMCQLIMQGLLPTKEIGPHTATLNNSFDEADNWGQDNVPFDLKRSSVSSLNNEYQRSSVTANHQNNDQSALDHLTNDSTNDSTLNSSYDSAAPLKTVRFLNFLREEQEHSLYERFLRAYFKKHFPQIQTSAMQIDWAKDNDFSDLLPTMHTDITLLYQQRYLIIDAKFYSTILLKHFGKAMINPNHLYQMFAYVKNLAHTQPHVSGLILYARTAEDKLPNQIYHLSGNTIGVKTIDLNCNFAEIAHQLNTIAQDFIAGRYA